MGQTLLLAHLVAMGLVTAEVVEQNRTPPLNPMAVTEVRQEVAGAVLGIELPPLPLGMAGTVELAQLESLVGR